MRYSIDSSALIFAWSRPYQHERFPSFWNSMDQLIQDGILIASDEVKMELARKQDDLFEWIQQRQQMFIEVGPDIQREVSRILTAFPDLVHPDSHRPQADAFVIAVARIENCKVVTQEKGGKLTRPKIPYVCAQYNIDCIDLYEFVAEQDWSF